jgi:hypothetical protein
LIFKIGNNQEGWKMEGWIKPIFQPSNLPDYRIWLSKTIRSASQRPLESITVVDGGGSVGEESFKKMGRNLLATNYSSIALPVKLSFHERASKFLVT